MSHLKQAVFLYLSVLMILSVAGCGDKSTNPDNDPPPADIGHLWSNRFGDTADDQRAYAVATDPSGNVIVTGYFTGSVDFGGGELASAGGYDIFVAKFGSDGTHLWSKHFGDDDDQLAHSVAVDASGNVIVTGYFEGSVDFGGDLLECEGLTDIFVSKFGADGTHVWSKRFGDEDLQGARSVAVDASGNLIITGYLIGLVDFGRGVLFSSGLFPDIWVAKLGSNGDHIWSKRFGDEDTQAAHSVAVDAAGNVIITGYFNGTVDFGGEELTSTGGYDIFLAKFGPDGSHLGSSRFGDGDANSQEGRAVAADIMGNVIVAGYFEGTVDFGGGELASAGAEDVFVAEFEW